MPGSGSTHVGASLWSVVGALKRGIAAKDKQCGSPLGAAGVRHLSRRGQRLSEAGREQPVAPG
jgi:hypothetical protein